MWIQEVAASVLLPLWWRRRRRHSHLRRGRRRWRRRGPLRREGDGGGAASFDRSMCDATATAPSNVQGDGNGGATSLDVEAAATSAQPSPTWRQGDGGGNLQRQRHAGVYVLSSSCHATSYGSALAPYIARKGGDQEGKEGVGKMWELVMKIMIWLQVERRKGTRLSRQDVLHASCSSTSQKISFGDGPVIFIFECSSWLLLERGLLWFYKVRDITLKMPWVSPAMPQGLKITMTVSRFDDAGFHFPIDAAEHLQRTAADICPHGQCIGYKFKNEDGLFPASIDKRIVKLIGEKAQEFEGDFVSIDKVEQRTFIRFSV
ncbi:hypothetical protein EJB05_18571, partial [Eragrostis curvula]